MSRPEDAVPSERVETASWIALVLPAAAWSAYVFVGWFLVPVSCDAGTGFVLHLLSVAALAIAAVGLVASLRATRRAGGGGQDTTGVGIGRFLPTVALLLSVLFLLGIVLIWSFSIFMSPCERG